MFVPRDAPMWNEQGWETEALSVQVSAVQVAEIWCSKPVSHLVFLFFVSRDGEHESRNRNSDYDHVHTSKTVEPNMHVQAECWRYESG
jgi:hypothetical protein